MFIGKALPFVRTFVDELDRALKRIEAEAGLSRLQKEWMGVLSGGHHRHQFGVLETL